MADKPNWTPGPWRAGINGRGAYPKHDEDGHTEVAIIPSADYDAAVVYAKKPRQQDPAPIAHLIAAAPELYAALAEVETIMTIVPPRSDTAAYMAALHKARAALAKARGE